MSATTGLARGPWQRARELSARTPLRVKLTAAVLALVAIALVTISIAGLGFLRGYLLGQADQQLTSIAFGNQDQAQILAWTRNYVVNGSSQPVADPQGLAVGWLTDGSEHVGWVALEPTKYRFSTPANSPAPSFRSPPRVDPHAAFLSGNVTETVGSHGGHRYRVLALDNVTVHSPGTSASGTVIVALDVTQVYQTLGKLTGIDIIVSSILLAGIAVIGVTVIRASLRPLTDIEKTAKAIAAGDLTQRVPEMDPQTEVGRLGRSLNAMLAQIEAAFQARSSSEAAARRSEDKMRQFVADASHELRTPLTAIRGFAEYYRQRGGVNMSAAAQLPAPPGRPALLPGPGSAPGPDSPPGPGGPGVPEGTGPEVNHGSAAGHENGSNGHTGLAPAELDRIMRRVEQESSRMGVLVEDMLLLARLDQQRPLEHRTVDLLSLAADAVHDARVVAPNRNIHLTVGAGAALLVLGDEVRLRQVIGNLMSNAMAHTPDGTPIDVRIRSGSLDEARSPDPRVSRPEVPPRMPAPPGGPRSLPWAAPPPAVPAASLAGLAAPGPVPAPPAPGGARSAAVLEVTDHGPGLTREQAQRAFERFYRADQARTSGGTGLGLAIVAALVAAHGGAVWVESEPGRGATFRIALPLAPEALQHDPDPDDDALPHRPPG